MACDIFTRAQKRIGGVWTDIEMRPVFRDSNYALFGFLANVRNYSAVPPLSEPRGLPEGVTQVFDDDPERKDDVPVSYLGDHSFSWLLIEELLAFDYNTRVEDRRVTQKIGGVNYGSITAEPGEGRMTTYRELLGAAFFADLRDLQDHGAERVVFGFND